jgi:hypothetical protein
MACTRHIIVCEGKSEWVYLQSLQRFLEQQLNEGEFDPPLRFMMITDTDNFQMQKTIPI